MTEYLIRFSVKNKTIVFFFTILLIGWGIYSLKEIPIDAVPDITNNQVQVVTISPSLAPQEVEQFITYPIEMGMTNLQNVVEIRSISRYGLSVVTIVFEEKVDVLDARQLVSERLQSIRSDIPEALGIPGMMPITTGLGEIYQYTLEVKEDYENKYSATELRTIHDWIVKRQLAGIPGIVEVSSFGGFLKQYEVSINPEKLRNYDITITEVFDALESSNENTGGSYIQKGPYAYYIRAEGMLKSRDDIGNVLVKNVNNVPILIKDIAEIKFGSAPRYGAMTKDGKGETVGGITLMLKGANAAEVTESVRARVKEVEKSLPEGLEIKPYLDRSELIKRVINTVSNNLIEGGLIVIFILVLLLGNLRAGLIIASIIPLSMLFALSMMNLFGISANLMSLGAIDFGLIVDATVIIVESIVHHIQKKFPNVKLSQEQLDKEVTESTLNIRKSASFGAVIILIVFLPILTLLGIEGKMFRPMAYTVSFAIIGALLLSFTYVPAVSSVFLKKKQSLKRTIDQRIMGFLERLYIPTIHYAMKRKALTIGSAVLVFVASLFVFNQLGAEFIPDLEEGDIAMQMTIAPGSSLNESIKTSTKAEQIILDNFPEVKSVISKIGTAEVPTDPMAVEDADIMIIMKPKKEWTSAKNRDDLVELMKKKLSVIVGASFEFTQPIQLRFNELMTGSKADISVKIFGDNLNVLFTKANEAARIISTIQGASDIKVEQIEGFPQLVVKYNRENVAYYGLNIKDLNSTVRTALAGEKTGYIFEGERKFDLVVRLEEKYRQDIETLKNLYIRTPSGTQIPLKVVADIQFIEGPMQISRDDTKRRITVGINIRNRDMQSLVDEVQEKLSSELQLPAGYYLTYGGEFENLQAAQKRGSITVPIALLLIFVLLYFTFHSLRQALMIYSAIPLAAIGGILALWIRGMPFSISAGIGFIALFGVAVLDGIVLISYFNQLKEEGMKDIHNRAIEGATRRLRPVIITSAVASLGFLPMAISTSAGAEVQRPLATVVIGGLITSTLLTLVFLPVVYTIYDKSKNISNKMKKTSALILLIISSSFIVNAQAPEKEISLDDALKIALSNNKMVTNANLAIQKNELDRKSAWEIEPLEVAYEYGELNTDVMDYSFTVNQSIGSPLLAISKKKYYSQKENLLYELKGLHEGTILEAVTSVYYAYWYESLKIKELKTLEQNYENLYKIAELKYKSGESNNLMKVNARVKLEKLWHEIEEMKMQHANTLIHFNKLLSADTTYIPDSLLNLKMKIPQDIAKQIKNIEGNSTHNILKEELSLADKEISVARNLFSPSFSFGYFNQQIEEVAGHQGFQVAVALPLFFGNQHKKVKQSRLNYTIKQNELQQYDYELQQFLEAKLNELNLYRTKLKHYEEHGIAYANTIISSAENLYQSGEINYIEYVQNLDDASELKMHYYEILNNCNQTMIQIYYTIH